MDIKESEKSMRHAYNLLFALAAINFIASVVFFSINSWMNLTSSTIGMVLELGLGYGVYKKSRVCAVASIVLYLFNFISNIILGNGRISPVSLIIACGCTILLVRGAVGAFMYNNLHKEEVAI